MLAPPTLVATAQSLVPASTQSAATLADQIVDLSIHGTQRPDDAADVLQLKKLLCVVRAVKNMVIGNRTRKEYFLQRADVVQSLVAFIASLDDGDYAAESRPLDESSLVALRQDLRIQTAIVIGSLANGKDTNAVRLAACGIINPLLACLRLSRADGSPPSYITYKLLDAVTRALKSLFAGPRTPRVDALHDHHILNLVNLLDVEWVVNSFKAANGASTSAATSVNFRPTFSLVLRIAESAAHIISYLISGSFLPFHSSSSHNSTMMGDRNTQSVSTMHTLSNGSTGQSATALHEQQVQKLIAKAGAIDMLIKLLYLGSCLNDPLRPFTNEHLDWPDGTTSDLMAFVADAERRHASFTKVCEAALEALASLCRENSSLSSLVVDSVIPDIHNNNAMILSVGLIARMLRQTPAATQLAAGTCLTNVYRAGVQNTLLQKEINTTVLPMLVKLFAFESGDNKIIKNTTTSNKKLTTNNSDTTTSISNFGMVQEYPTAIHEKSPFGPILEKAPLVFAYLVSESEDLQQAAAEADAIPRLAELLRTIDRMSSSSSLAPFNRNTPLINGTGTIIPNGDTLESAPGSEPSYAFSHDRLKESILLALAAACSMKEECRKQVIDAKILSNIVAGMLHHAVGVRAAACQCTRSLSRSVKNLRTFLVDAGVADPLFKLLSDESIHVQVTASATLCNIVLDFSPMKQAFLDNGGVEKLVALALSGDSNVRLNAVWALKNLVYNASSATKSAVMSLLTYKRLFSLLHDPEASIQEQALNLLRNLVCGSEADVHAVFVGFNQGELLSMIEAKLKSPNSDVAYQALYIIVNMCTGSEQHKNAIMNHSNILVYLMQYLSHTKAAMRVAATWCVINLTWPEDTDPKQRIEKLREQGFEDKLQAMVNDPELDVRERVKAALGQFAGVEVGVRL